MTGLSSAIARAAVVTRIDLTQLWVDGDPSAGPRQISGVQARDGLQERVVVDYLDALLDEEPLPPIRVLVDAEGVHRVVDGWHRLEAHRRASRLQIDAVVEEGDERAAILEAAGANAAHGLQRSAADKRRAVRLLLADPEWATWSDRAIGQRCRVHHSFVGSIRRELAEETGAVASAERRGRDGRVIDTSRIGRPRTVAEEVEADLRAEREVADRVGTPVVGAEAEALLEDETEDRDPPDRDPPDREEFRRWEADMDRRIADGSFETGIAGVDGDDAQGQDGDEDLDDRSSADAEVVTEARLETAILPSSSVPRADDVVVITVWEPADLLLSQILAVACDLESLSRSTPDQRRKLGRKHLLTWRGRQWVRIGGSGGGPFEAFRLVAIVPEDGAELPPLAGEGEPGSGYYHRVRVLVSGTPLGRTGERVPYLLDARHVAHVAYGVRRHGADFFDRRWDATTPQLSLEETKIWDGGAGEERRQVLEAARIRHLAAQLRDAAPPVVPAEEPPSNDRPIPSATELEALPNQLRAPWDAYWTPRKTALACVAWLLEFLESEYGLSIADRGTVIEPSVGGGAWVEALRVMMPTAVIDRCDIDPKAPGLDLDFREGLRRMPATRADLDKVRGDRALRVDWLSSTLDDEEWDLCVGNPPYQAEIIMRFVEACLARAGVVALLLRETFTGTEDRLPFWGDNPPAVIAKVVPRPKWEGPGARPTSDMADTVLVVWFKGKRCDTRFRWLNVPAVLAGLADVVDPDADGEDE